MSGQANPGATLVAPIHAFDVAALAAFVRARIGAFEGPLAVEQFQGGQSNPTYRVAAGSERFVLRRKPPGALLPSAHAVDREYRVMSALAGTGVPVPRMRALCADPAVIGTAFYLMDYVEGRILWDPTLPGMTPSQRGAHYDELNRVIAALHCVDPAAAGLADFGRSGGYIERQVARWTKQYQAGVADRIDAMDRLIEWLPPRIPPGDETRVVHGDFRIDNVIFHPDEPRVLAVLDWELSTLGHPLADFTYHLMMYRMPPLVTVGLKGADLQALNVPSESDYVAAYCARTSRASIPHLDFYLAFNFFRFSAIAHGIKGRLARGTAASPQAQRMVEAFPILAELAWQQALLAGAPARAGASASS